MAAIGNVNGDGGGKMLQKVLVGLIPMLVVGMTTLLVWVVEIRSSRYTQENHLTHLQHHQNTIPSQEVLRRLERIETKIDMLEEKMNKN